MALPPAAAVAWADIVGAETSSRAVELALVWRRSRSAAECLVSLLPALLGIDQLPRAHQRNVAATVVVLSSSVRRESLEPAVELGLSRPNLDGHARNLFHFALSVAAEASKAQCASPPRMPASPAEAVSPEAPDRGPPAIWVAKLTDALTRGDHGASTEILTTLTSEETWARLGECTESDDAVLALCEVVAAAGSSTELGGVPHLAPALFQNVLVPRVAGLTAAASRPLAGATSVAAKAYPRLASQFLFTKAIVEGTNSAQAETLGRIARQLLGCELARDTVVAVAQMRWTNQSVRIVEDLLHASGGAPEAVTAVIVAMDRNGSALSSSLHFAKLGMLLATRYAGPASSNAATLRSAMRKNTSFLAKAVLSKPVLRSR